MKKINLNNFQSEKGKYTVCLGNGTATVFTNKEKAERFLAETSTFLTQQLYNINSAETLVAALCKKRSSTDALYKIDFLFKTVLTNIENDLNNYAFLGARLFKVPVHELDHETEYKPDLKNVKLKAI